MPSGNGKLSFERDIRDPVFAPFTARELTPGDAVADDDALPSATTNATVIMLAERIYQRVYAN